MSRYHPAPPLLNRFRLLASQDLDEARRMTGQSLAKHFVHVVARSRFQTLVNGLESPGMGLLYVDCPTPLHIELEQGPGRYYVQMHLAGHAIHRIHGIQTESHRRQAAFVAPGERQVMSPGPTRALLLTLPRQAVDAALFPQPREKLFSTLASRHFSLVAGPGFQLKKLCRFIAGKLDAAGPGWLRQDSWPHLENRVLSTFLQCIGAHEYPGLAKEPEPGLDRLAKLEEWITVHLHQPIEVETMAALVGLQVRTVQNLFQKHRGMSPLAFLRERRLEEARRLLVGHPIATVGEVARKLGFFHMGRFSSQYRQKFGEYPSETLSRKN